MFEICNDLILAQSMPSGAVGAIEAVNGLILFGLTTAFLYAAIHQVWPLRRD